MANQMKMDHGKSREVVLKVGEIAYNLRKQGLSYSAIARHPAIGTPKSVVTIVSNIYRYETNLRAIDAEHELKDGLVKGSLSIREIRLEDLDLSVRAKNCCRNAGLETLADLDGLSSADLLKTKNLGKKCVLELDEKLVEFGLKGVLFL